MRTTTSRGEPRRIAPNSLTNMTLFFFRSNIKMENSPSCTSTNQIQKNDAWRFSSQHHFTRPGQVPPLPSSLPSLALHRIRVLSQGDLFRHPGRARTVEARTWISGAHMGGALACDRPVLSQSPSLEEGAVCHEQSRFFACLVCLTAAVMCEGRESDSLLCWGLPIFHSWRDRGWFLLPWGSPICCPSFPGCPVAPRLSVSGAARGWVAGDCASGRYSGLGVWTGPCAHADGIGVVALRCNAPAGRASQALWLFGSSW